MKINNTDEFGDVSLIMIEIDNRINDLYKGIIKKDSSEAELIAKKDTLKELQGFIFDNILKKEK